MLKLAKSSEENFDASPLTQAKPTQLAIKPGDLLMVFVVVTLWGIAFVGMKVMVREAPPFKAAGIRFFLAALPLLVLALQPSRLKKLRPLDFAKFALVGFLQTTILFAIHFSALRAVPAGVSSIILNTNPFFVAIFAHLLIPGDRLSKQKLIGLVLGFSGVLVLVVGGKGLGEVALYWPLLLLTAAAVWAFSAILVKKLKFQDMLSLTTWQCLFGSLPLLLIGYSLESQPVNWNWDFILWTLYVALVASSFGWWALYRLLQRYSASRVSVFLFLIPVGAVLSSVLLLGETLNPNIVAGGTLVAVGIIVVNSSLGFVARFKSVRFNKGYSEPK